MHFFLYFLYFKMYIFPTKGVLLFYGCCSTSLYADLAYTLVELVQHVVINSVIVVIRQTHGGSVKTV